jgi:hypothetical protein
MRWVKDLAIATAGAAIVTTLDHVGVFEKILGSRLAVLLVQPIATYAAVLLVAVAFLLGLALARRNGPASLAVPPGEPPMVLPAPAILPVQPEEPRNLPRDLERALEILLVNGNIQASELRGLLGATPANFELLMHELEEGNLASRADTYSIDPLVRILDNGRAYLADKARREGRRFA